jgi:hypothetical protein
MDQPGLMAWPQANDATLRDTGEGGMYAYLFVDWEGVSLQAEGGCTVDVEVSMSYPDVALTDRELWPSWGQNLDRTFDSLRSRSAAATVFLGATNQSLWVEAAGTYYTATAANLTPAGDALYGGLWVAFRAQPRIITFLDT